MLARDADEAVDIVDKIAPEHLEIIAEDAEDLCAAIDNAGAIFLGPYSPVAVGDYAAGPSHVLPTGGTARFERPDGQRLPAAVERAGVHARRPGTHGRRCGALANVEGLTAHAASVDVRLADEKETPRTPPAAEQSRTKKHAGEPGA